jgi:hypothetical protein
MPNPNDRQKLSPEHEAMAKDLYGDLPAYGERLCCMELRAENARLMEEAREWAAAAYGVVTGDIDVGPRTVDAFKRLETLVRDALKGKGT